jgi:SPX domain protein involved in polyphosphate accumulation
VLAALRDTLASDAPHAGRREFKYLLPRVSDDRAVAMVRARVPGLRQEFAPRQVSSLYFDTASYTCFDQSNAGASERVKVRLRWYGAFHPETALTLELKHRANHLGWKSQYALPPLDLATIPLASLSSRFAALVSPRERPLVEMLRRPILVTTYWRHYFATADGAIRVTVDTGLRFIDQRLRPRLTRATDALSTDFAVVECKLAQSHEGEGARLLRALAPRQTRFSKYCCGVERLSAR